MADRSGQQLETYHLLRRLGGGMFGDVYLAEDRRKRQVAIKILHGEFDNSRLQDFLREARIIRLRHENIISVLDFGIEPSQTTPYIVMDYAAKGTLLTKHPRGTKIPLEAIVSYVRQIASALQQAHDEDIIHRDVKPENILLDQHGIIKLGDFGISIISQSGRTSLENPQGRAGTAWYMAPEQIQGKPSRASDQYALGIIVYEWLTGAPPFAGGILEVYGQHLYSPPDPLPKNIQMMTPEIEAIVMRALAKSAKDRFPSIQEFATTLDEAYRRSSSAYQMPAVASKTKEQWIDEGNRLYREKRYDDALTAYNRAMSIDPRYALAYTNRAVAYEVQKMYPEAIRDYTYSLELDPKHALTYNNRGNAYRGQKRYDEAIRDYTKSIELDPKYPAAYINRGVAYENLKQYDEAIKDYTKALELDPNYALAYTNRGNAYEAQKMYTEAVRDYSKALELDPKYVFAYNNRGNAYEAQKMYTEAIRDYSKAIELDPNYARPYVGRGVAYELQKMYAEAIRDYGKAIEIDPNYALAYTNRGNVYQAQKLFPESLRDYTKAISLDPSYAKAYNNRGYTYYLQKDYKEAIADYERALKVDPNYSLARNNRDAAQRKLEGK